MTRRDDVLDALVTAPGFRSAQALYAELRGRGVRIGLATVYRVLQSMSGGGEVDAVRTAGGEMLYRLCRSHLHHHHLLCRTCGVAEELDAAFVDDWVRAVAQQHGFVAVDHVLEIVGTCAECAARPDPAP